MKAYHGSLRLATVLRAKDPDPISLPLALARLCPDTDCAEIYVGPACPKCGSAEYVDLARLLSGPRAVPRAE